LVELLGRAIAIESKVSVPHDFKPLVAHRDNPWRRATQLPAEAVGHTFRFDQGKERQAISDGDFDMT
jgi:hypothetical protein